ESASIPGILAVGASRVPPGQTGSDGSYKVDKEIAAGLSISDPQAVFSIVAPGTFGVLGIPLRAGRDFSDADSPDAPMTAIINEALARRSFPGMDPIGHSIMCGMDILKPMTIVGVVADIRQRGPGKDGLPEIYMPYQQHPMPSTSL